MLRGCLSLVVKFYAIGAALAAIVMATEGAVAQTIGFGVASLVLFGVGKAITGVPARRQGKRVARIKDLMGEDYPFRYFYAAEGIAVSTDEKRIVIVRSSDVVEQYKISQVSAVDVFDDGRARCALKLTVRDPESPICTFDFAPKDAETAEEFRLIIRSMMN